MKKSSQNSFRYPTKKILIPWQNKIKENKHRNNTTNKGKNKQKQKNTTQQNATGITEYSRDTFCIYASLQTFQRFIANISDKQ